MAFGGVFLDPMEKYIEKTKLHSYSYIVLMFIWNKHVLAASLTETVSTVIQGYKWYNNTVSPYPKSWCVHVCRHSLEGKMTSWNWKRKTNNIWVTLSTTEHVGKKLLQTTFWGQQKPVLRLKKWGSTNKHINLSFSFLYQLHDYMFNFAIFSSSKNPDCTFPWTSS